MTGLPGPRGVLGAPLREDLRPSQSADTARDSASGLYLQWGSGGGVSSARYRAVGLGRTVPECEHVETVPALPHFPCPDFD